jgi:uracil-DNA glycosylase family 4
MNGTYQQQYLKEIGITVWSERELVSIEATPTDIKHVSEENKPLRKELGQELSHLANQVEACDQCELHKSRTQTVFGVGNKNADWLIVGEAPDADEDFKGEPFVGRAGKLLNAMLFSMGLQRQEVFIANILKCRPPKNRDPKINEVEACEKYLRQQIALIKPKIILALGRIAAQNLLKLDTPIGKMRGNSYLYPDTNLPVVVTYHPAYLLCFPREKRKVWQDIKFAQDTYRELV